MAAPTDWRVCATPAWRSPDVDVAPETVQLVMVSECAPADTADWFYAPGTPLFAETTVAAFQDAGADVASMADVLAMGVYVTTGINCGKTGYTVKAASVKSCSLLLEEELALFADVHAYMLMGDVAIRAFALPCRLQ